jgi:NAD+-dependent protein deacetylase sirtuin 4
MNVPLVPDPPCDVASAVDAVASILRGRRACVLTGAGVSTESGIPDYRGPGTARRARNPMRFQQFVGDAQMRARYWARASVGWPRMATARPNPGHHALAALEQAGHLTGIITQNVDRLHHKAGSRRVIELHGALHDVTCLACGLHEDRDALQTRLLRVNPGFRHQRAEQAPDGDADVTDARIERFRVVGCLDCGGPLKPDVVFFGESVPRPRVEAAYALVDEAEALLVVGSSLTVFSGLRFVKRAHKAGKPIVIVNVGETRGDPLARLKVEARAGALLPALADRLAPADALLAR